ncbi:hypothetical protein ACFW9F_27660 [Streptomyces sp. NPDC059506]|uniref:hypothetical protein n=1 Tax=Streptomyces sp. NPDC059506 TaxID=3347751 RepID=UPI0036C74C8E
MTTHRYTSTVTARIGTGVPAPAKPATNPSSTYTVTAHMNVSPDHFFGHRSGHAVAEVTTNGTPLRLTFNADRVTDSHSAADAAFVVGNAQGSDDMEQNWPADVRSLSVGDVLAVTGPDGATVHLRIDPVGFSEIQPPMNRVELSGTRATARTS